MTGRRGLLGLPLVAVLLGGCGSDPVDARRADVAALTAAANDGDAERVREHADALLATVAAQRERDEIPVAEADRLTALARKVRSSADAIDVTLLEQRRREAEAAAAQARKQIEEQRRKAEEAARKAAEDAAREDEGKDEDEGKEEGKGKEEGRDKDD